MTQQDKQGNQDKQDTANPGNAQRAENRSENLLPGDDGGDGRYEVAEEVNLDQQSDQLRRVGHAPKGIASDALPESLKGSDDDAGRQG